MSDLIRPLAVAADLVVEVVGRDDVSEAWQRPSALAQWSVGGLTAHFAGQLSVVARLLAAPPDTGPITLAEHYARARWVGAGVDDEVNADIRAGGDEQAALGRDAVLARAIADREAALEQLAAQPEDRVVLIPWQGWSLSLADFVTTRLMEVVVHGEDVAASVGFVLPRLPDEVLTPVLGLLTGLAVTRHGQGAVVSALSRTERAPGSISAF